MNNISEPATENVSTRRAVPPARASDAAKVTSVTHWSDQLFSFRVERPASLRFRSGEFVMLGLMRDPDPETGKQLPLLRAYSIASPSWEEDLEFYSIKVPDGPLTSKLQHLQPGDSIILRPRPVGTLIIDALLPGKRLWLLSTGTGVAPFASLIQDPETYEKFDSVILMHTCRQVEELAYSRKLVDELLEHEYLTEIVKDKLVYYPSTTREVSENQGRITDTLQTPQFFESLGIEPLNAEVDRAMICGSLTFNEDIQAILHDAGMTEGSSSEPGTYVVEKAFVGEG